MPITRPETRSGTSASCARAGATSTAIIANVTTITRTHAGTTRASHHDDDAGVWPQRYEVLPLQAPGDRERRHERDAADVARAVERDLGTELDRDRELARRHVLEPAGA